MSRGRPEGARRLGLRRRRWLLLVMSWLLAVGCARGGGTPSPGGSSETAAGGQRRVEVLSEGSRMLIRPQTATEAFSYLERTLAQMDFFRANGYEVALPDHPRFRPTTRSEPKTQVDGVEEMREVFSREVYDPRSFDAALEVLRGSRDLLRQAVVRLERLAALDGFIALPRYEVVLTLYGTGGSYDPDSKEIVLLTTEDGAFKGGGGPYTLVHEMVHLAVEEGAVQRFGLRHWEKERLVDLLCRDHFGDLLPGYVLQEDGVSALDPFVEGIAAADLSGALARYVAEGRPPAGEGGSPGVREGAPEGPSSVPVNAELSEIYRQDQSDRSPEAGKTIDWSVVSPRDRARKTRVTEILATGGARLAADFYHAAMVFQHGGSPEDYQRARDLARKAVELEPGHELARWLSAAAHDRYLLSVGAKQVYGTQFRRSSGDASWELSPIDENAVTDAQRRELGVPTLEEMKRRLEAMSAPP